MKAPSVRMAACGLDCQTCSLRTFPFDSEAAEEALSWYRKQGWLEEGEGVEEAVVKGLYCKGCHGPRNEHWSPDCWILACCVDARNLDTCTECREFPCKRLLDWSEGNEAYSQALRNLHSISKDFAGREY
ncbi:DUF3795 domain-containing protein [Candidatus Thorarchaeota archaeon]|nr:MAG: DUF3795 domain-containing protein [Candidatus Thorarchaeota archaeon]